jgi:hypothetical protein
MANQSLLTYNAKVTSVLEQYKAPIAQITVAPGVTTSLATIYGFIARVDPWSNDVDPPTPTQDVKTLKNIAKNIFAVKKITSNDIKPIVQRIDWTTGTTYDYYRDDIDMFAVDSNGLLVLQFYIKNRYDQVFKCLWNANGAPSTVEPFFQPGSYGTNNMYLASDGYKWKYLYTIDTGSKVKFMDSAWMPVTNATTTEDDLASPAGVGSIDAINVTNGGSGYDPANSIIYVTVTGDGASATGTATVENGSITDIIVTNPGSNYTYANVIISSASGSGATAIAPTSPTWGHGFDPTQDLAPNRVMLVVEFDGSESGNIPTNIEYRQFGIMINPTALSSNPFNASGSVYKTTTDLVLAPGSGQYTNDEVIYIGSSLATATFIGTVLSFNTSTNVLNLINTTGTPSINGLVQGSVSGTTRSLLSYSTPDFITASGFISYIENRTGINRSTDGIEQFKVILSY